MKEPGALRLGVQVYWIDHNGFSRSHRFESCPRYRIP